MTGMGKLYDQGYRVTTADKAHLESSDGMISTLMRWQELSRVWIGHWLSRPFHHLFNLMPGVEVGLSTPAITRLPLIHAPLAGRRAVHLSDLHLDRYRPRHRALVRTVADLSA